jgi:hypothetical protein
LAASASTAENPASAVTAVSATRSVHSDLMGDRPPGRRGGFGPPIGRQVGDHAVEVVAFRT